MRLPLLVVPALMISAPAASEGPIAAAAAPGSADSAPAVMDRNTPERKTCRSTGPHFAGSGSAWTGDPVRPRKLDELPPATAYMAVLRTVDGCEEPLTVVEYRNNARP